jgi:hypothetical protein
MKMYVATVLTFGALAFSAGIPLTPAHAKDVSAMGAYAAASQLPACPSLFRCVVK